MKQMSEVKAMEAAHKALSCLKPDEKRRALVWLWEKLEILGQAPSASGQIHPQVSAPCAQAYGAPNQTAAIGSLTPKNFLAQKDPKTDLEKVTCLAYYLTHNRGVGQFKTKLFTKLNTEAAQPNFSNPAVAVANAAAVKYLSPAGGREKADHCAR